MPRRSLRSAALALLLPVVAGGDDDGGGAATSTSSSASSPSATSSGSASSTTTSGDPPGTMAPADGQVVEIEVSGGRPVGGPVGEEVPLGTTLTIRVTADAADEVHVHGYDLTVAVGPDEPGELTFVADIPGQFEVELHDSGALVAELTVG